MNEYEGLIAAFVFYYPILMSYLWMAGGSVFFWRYERKVRKAPVPSKGSTFSVLIPCHNEGKLIEDTVRNLLGLDYPDFEIVLVDDGSKDNTPAIVKELASRHLRVRAFCLEKNMGKAAALNFGVRMCTGNYIMTLDADALLDRDALKWMGWHFDNFPKVGAVTGNPRVLNRTTLLSKIQTGEYSTIIGLIKRSQRILGKILTVSGVVAAFRKEAITSVGLWDTTMITDDIDITWKLQRGGWDVRFEPRAICWIFVPETLKGLWRQRLRWAQGGVEVVIKHRGVWLDYRQRRLWPIYAEYVLSTIWSYMLWGLVSFELAGIIMDYRMSGALPDLSEKRLWLGAIPLLTCITQFAISFGIERRYDKNLLRCLVTVIWYPLIYWVIIASTVIVAVPKAIFRKKGPAIWTSPDRGLDKI